MKKILLLCLIALAGSINLNAQTYVKGGIYSNTTWTTLGSPYIVTDTVVVFQGITLTIQPGVKVEFYNNQYMDIRGDLYANGTSTDSIIFTSYSVTPKAGIWAGINKGTSYSYCSFYYANNAINAQYVPNPISHCSFTSCLIGIQWGNFGVDSCSFRFDTNGILQGTQVVTSSTFQHNGIGLFQGQNSAYSCTFRYNNYGIRNVGESTFNNCIFDSNRAYGLSVAFDTVRNCSIQYNGTGISNEEGFVELSTISNNNIGFVVIANEKYSCNSICSNKTYNCEMEQPANNLATDNYWCLTDSANILKTIYDGRTNTNLGLLIFTPFDTIPCSTLPASGFSIAAYATNNNITPCNSSTLNVLIFDTGAMTTSILWMPGGNTSASYIVSPSITTTYTVTVTNTSNSLSQVAYVTVNVNPTIHTPTSLCYVTADTTSQHNIIVWSKSGMDTLNADSVVIYREMPANSYAQIGTSPIHGYTEFTDITSNPQVESYFYAIGLKDTCSFSNMSYPVESTLLQSSIGLGGQITLTWNLFAGNPANEFRILRDDSGTGNWHVIDSVSSNISAYTDITAPSSPNLRYVLNIEWPYCGSYLAPIMQKHGPHFKFDLQNQSYSNIVNVGVEGVQAILNPGDFDVYPNPTTTELFIALHQSINGTATITNVLGQEVYTGNISGSNNSVQKIDVSTLQQGVYFLKLESNGQVLTKKVLKI